MTAMADSNPFALHCRGITVTFGETTALSDICLDLAPGKIHAIVGENGAGKTTLARTAAGLLRPDSGDLTIYGTELRFGSIDSARSAGVELVHQSFALPPSFNVAEALEYSVGGNIGFFTRRRLFERWNGHLRALDIEVDSKKRIRDLPIEVQQGVEIARALVTDAKVLILDEPTAVLPPPGIRALFERIRSLKDRGVSIVLILHKIREVFQIADTISVLRKSRLIAGPLAGESVSEEEVAHLIVGSQGKKSSGAKFADALIGRAAAHAQKSNGDTGIRKSNDGHALLRIDGISTEADGEGQRLNETSLHVDAGEIVGVAGVEGNGQLALVRALADLSDLRSGSVELCGQDVTNANLAYRRSLGLRIIPFDRNAEGLSMKSELWRNWSARELALSPLLSGINPSAIRRRCRRSLANWDVRFSSTRQYAGSLSGGNAQKLVLSRELDDQARLVIAAQPTRGLDIGAASFVWATLRQASERGCGILLISSDLDELFGVSDRLLVMLSGQIVEVFSPPYDLGETGRAMTGA